MKRSKRSSLVAAALGLAAATAGCGGVSEGSSGGSGRAGSVALVAYSTPKEAYEELIPAFGRTPAGQGVRFSQSYGASGEQARAVVAGLPADVVALSLAPDVEKLVEAGLVSADWAAGEHAGIVTTSVVVFAVRKGNPKNIRTWDDLLQEGVEVVTPNPFTSGGAKWNIMAAYGAQLERGRSEAQGVRFLRDLFDHVVVQDKSAREALQTFSAGKGDVLLSYENEAITARQKGLDLDYVVPDETILIENPIAVTERAKSPAKARAFVDFLLSPEAQRVYAEKGYRTVLKAEADATRFPVPPGLFRIGDVGGWARVNARFFDPDEGILADIERDLGVGTG